MGVVFFSSVTRMHANVHAWNLILRRFGIKPHDPGASVIADKIKYPLGRMLVRYRARFRGYKPQAGM